MASVSYVSRGSKGTATVVRDDFCICPDYDETEFFVKHNNQEQPQRYVSEAEAKRIADKLSGKNEEAKHG